MKKISNFLFGSSNYDWKILLDVFRNWTRAQRWRLFGIISATALIAVIIVSNVRAVNKMLISVRKMEKKEKELINYNKVLKKEIIELESPQRITKIAKEEFGFVQNEEKPKKITLSNK